jgi:hypothetical protein
MNERGNKEGSTTHYSNMKPNHQKIINSPSSIGSEWMVGLHVTAAPDVLIACLDCTHTRHRDWQAKQTRIKRRLSLEVRKRFDPARRIGAGEPVHKIKASAEHMG